MADEVIPDKEKENSNETLTDTEKLKRLTEKYLKDLTENPKYKSYFDRYEASSVKSFIEHFARHKSYLEVYGHSYERRQSERISKYSAMANKKLWEIQQRKLFDLQCRWRADMVKVPEINTTADFEYFEGRIHECTFLTPINDEEFERYMTFIEQSSLEDIMFECDSNWQDYEEFKGYYLNEGTDDEDLYLETPPWYEFYENITGLSSLYMLEDIRGEKEEFYTTLFYNERNKKNGQASQSANNYVPDDRPRIPSYDDDFNGRFIEKFENQRLLNYHLYYITEDEIEGDDELEDAIQTLKNADRNVSIKENTDWKKAVKDAANSYIKTKLIEQLPIAYKNYLFRIESMLSFQFEETTYKTWEYSIAKYHNEAVLGGRELNGEPRDFNF